MDWKSYTLGLATTYAVGAVLTGFAFGNSMPALNWLGQMYVGATWLGALFCTATFGCDVLPPQDIANHFFTFD
jgi:hypothetical protein